MLRRAATNGSSWRRYHAGMLVLRLAAGVLLSDRPPTGRALTAVRQALQGVDRPRSRALLHSIVAATTKMGPDPADAIIDSFIAYGTYLYREGSYPLSVDVYRATVAVITHLGTSHELATAHYWMGYALRECSDDVKAREAFTAARWISERDGDRALALKARIALASIEWAAGRKVDVEYAAGGNHRAAEILDRVLSDAEAAQLPDIVAAAAHDRGVVACQMGDHRLAFTLYTLAFRLHTEQYRRFRLLPDIGRSLVAVGLFDVAREALLATYLAAPERFARLTAGLNLLDLAVVAGHEDSFEQYRMALADAALPAHLRLAYWLTVGEGCLAFGQPDDARLALERARRLAARYGLKPEYQQATDRLAGNPLRDLPPKTSDMWPELAPLVDAVRSFGGLSSLLRLAHEERGDWDARRATGSHVRHRRRKWWRAAGTAPTAPERVGRAEGTVRTRPAPQKPLVDFTTTVRQ